MRNKENGCCIDCKNLTKIEIFIEESKTMYAMVHDCELGNLLSEVFIFTHSCDKFELKTI